MKRDQCNEEFANSGEVKRHKEQAHPMGESKDPDLVEDPGMSAGIERTESEMPEAAGGAVRRGRVRCSSKAAD